MFRKFRIFNGLGKLGNSGFTRRYSPAAPALVLVTPSTKPLCNTGKTCPMCIGHNGSGIDRIVCRIPSCIVFRRQRRNRVKKNARPRSFNSEGNEQPIAYRSERFSAMFALRFRNSSTCVSTREKQYSGPIALFSIISFCGERHASRISFEISSVSVRLSGCWQPGTCNRVAPAILRAASKTSRNLPSPSPR